MSWDRKTRQKICREHASEIVEIARGQTRSAQEREERNQYKKSDKCKRDNARRALLQKLDKANPENKIQNTINFLNDVIALFESEYKELLATKKVTELDIVEIAKGFAVHVKLLREFDEKTELNEDLGYSEKLLTILERKLEELNPKFLDYVELPLSVVLSL